MSRDITGDDRIEVPPILSRIFAFDPHGILLKFGRIPQERF